MHRDSTTSPQPHYDEKQKENSEKKKRRTQELTTWGLQDTRLTELSMREVLLKNKIKKHDCRYNSKPPSTQLQRQGTKLPSLSSS